MKFEIGDRIIILHTGEEGTVAEILNDKMIMVEVAGVRYPVFSDQIDFPYFKWFTEKKPAQNKKVFIEDVKKEKKEKTDNSKFGVFLRFFPVYNKDVFDDDEVEKLKIYLVNQNKEDYDFSYGLYYSGDCRFELKNTVRKNSDFYLHDVSVEELSDNPRFAFEFTLHDRDKRKADYFEASIRLKAKQYFKKIQEIQLKNEPSFWYELFTVYPDKEIWDTGIVPESKGSVKIYELSGLAKNLPRAREVIDLHIERLVENPKDLSGKEILEKQLDEFERFYSLAVIHRLPKFIVIHGIGEGILREEIHSKLRTKKEVSSFINQYHPSYGFGATEIYFSY